LALTTTGFRKKIILYTLAVILPCVVLVAVTYRMVRQEQELAHKSAAEESSRLAGEIGQALLMRLENMKLQEVDALATGEGSASAREYANQEIVLIAEVKDGRIILPWDRDSRIEEAEQALAQALFTARKRSGEEEEFIRKNYSRAAVLYRRCRDTSEDPIQKGYAAVCLARVLNKADRTAEALSQYRNILDLPPTLLDEYGIPLLLYAVKPLMKDPGGPGDVSEKLKVLLNGENWLSPAAILFVQGAVQEMMAQKMEDSIEAQVELLQEQAQESQRFYEAAADLQQRFPGLGLMSDRRGTQQETSALWVSFDRQHWLVGLAPEALESSALCIVISGPAILDSIKQEFSHTEGRAVEFDWTSGDLSEGESLGPSLRSLGIRFSPSFISSLVEQRSPQRTLYGLLVLLVLSLTFFGGYLLWRDVRRELRLAEMRSQFVSSVSHELKTPLTAIRMFAETLRMGRSKDPKVQQEYLDTIVNESQRLTRLLNNVLDFSKIEQGERQYHMQPAALAEVIQAAARTMAYPLSQQGFQLHVQIEPNLPDIRMDRDALEQAVLNLLSNAMKYSGDSRDIDLRLTRNDRSAIIQVIDRGLGIAQAEKGRIFDKYYRIHTGESVQSAGTGLGLALVSHIVASHGGRIEVESEPGKGSTFSIHMPFEEMS